MSWDGLRHVVVSDYAKTLIRVKARQLCRRLGSSRSDEDDLQQELSLLLYSKLPQFDPDRASLPTFIDRVIESGVRMLLRNARRLKRGSGMSPQSLDATDTSGSQRPLRDAVQQDAHARRTGQSAHDPQDVFTDRDAAEHAIAVLPDDLRSLCLRLKESDPTPLAEQFGMSRHQMRQAIAQIRRYFVRAGFEEMRICGRGRRRRHR